MCGRCGSTLKKNLPTGCWKIIEGMIKTKTMTKKIIAVGSKVLYDIHLIISRVIRTQAIAKEVDFKDVLSYELAPNPTALFDDLVKT